VLCIDEIRGGAAMRWKIAIIERRKAYDCIVTTSCDGFVPFSLIFRTEDDVPQDRVLLCLLPTCGGMTRSYAVNGNI